jgi:hypothetical protein
MFTSTEWRISLHSDSSDWAWPLWQQSFALCCIWNLRSTENERITTDVNPTFWFCNNLSWSAMHGQRRRWSVKLHAGRFQVDESLAIPEGRTRSNGELRPWFCVLQYPQFSFRTDKIQHNEVLRINSIVMDFRSILLLSFNLDRQTEKHLLSKYVFRCRIGRIYLIRTCMAQKQLYLVNNPVISSLHVPDIWTGCQSGTLCSIILPIRDSVRDHKPSRTDISPL